MEIIYNAQKAKDSYPQQYNVSCTYCDSEIKLSFDETTEGPRGWRYFKCPVCGCTSCATEIDTSMPKKNELVFPKHFWRIDSIAKTNEFNTRTAVNVSQDDIRELIKDATKHIDSENDYAYAATGDTFVFAYKTGEKTEAAEEEVEVVIAKNYWVGAYRLGLFDKN